MHLLNTLYKHTARGAQRSLVCVCVCVNLSSAGEDRASRVSAHLGGQPASPAAAVRRAKDPVGGVRAGWGAWSRELRRRESWDRAPLAARGSVGAPGLGRGARGAPSRHSWTTDTGGAHQKAGDPRDVPRIKSPRRQLYRGIPCRRQAQQGLLWCIPFSGSERRQGSPQMYNPPCPLDAERARGYCGGG